MNAFNAHWEHFHHQADVGVRGVGPSLAAAFEQAALALMAVMGELSSIDPVRRVDLSVQSTNHEQLLVDWLSELVYKVAVDKLLFSRFEVQIHGYRLQGAAWGETIDVARHQPAVEVKGITYTQLQVTKRQDGAWVAQCVVDV